MWLSWYFCCCDGGFGILVGTLITVESLELPIFIESNEHVCLEAGVPQILSQLTLLEWERCRQRLAHNFDLLPPTHYTTTFTAHT